MLIALAALVLVALVVAFFLKRQEIMEGVLIDGLIGVLCLLAIGLLIPSVFMRSSAPAPGTGFEQAAAWKLGQLVSKSRDSGEVVVFLDAALKGPVGDASHAAQRAGIEEGLSSGLKPVWADLSPDGGGEFGELDGLDTTSSRAKAIYAAVEAANEPVAVLSMVPVTEHIPDALLDRIPLVFTFEQDESKIFRERLEAGEYGAVVRPRSDSDNTQKASRGLQQRFDQRFEVVR